MKFKTLILGLLIIVFAVGAMAADLAVTCNERGTAGDYDWARGTIVWSSTTYCATDKIHARALGVGYIGFIQLMPYGNNAYTACPESFTSPKDSVGIYLYYIDAADTTGTGTEADGSTSCTFNYWVMSK